MLGALIGDLFGAKPKIPTASADTILAIPSATYVVGNETSANGGDLGIATEMADTARDTLNGIIAQITGNNPNAIVQNLSSPTQDYGYDANGLYVKLNGAKTYYSSADQAVNAGVMWALPQTQIIGGDIFLKRAIANGSTTDLTTLMGDLQIASDYEFYTNNRALINSEITAAYATLSSDEMAFYDNNKALVDQVDMSGVSSLNSSQLSTYNANQSTIAAIVQALQAQSVANPWIVTLESANELGLDQWSPSDFYGGMYGFLSSFGLGNMGSGVHFENVSVEFDGTNLGLSLPSANGGPGVFASLPQSSNASDGDMVTNPRFQDNLAGWNFATNVAGSFYGVDLPGWYGSGNDTYYEGLTGASTYGLDDLRSGFIPVTAGDTYEASVEAAQHRGLAQAYVEFYDANMTLISTGDQFLNGNGYEMGSVGGELSTYDQIGGFVTAPAGAAYSRLVLRLWGFGGSSPYAFFTQPMFEAVNNGGDMVPNPRFQYGAEFAGPQDWGVYSTTSNYVIGVDLPGWSGEGNDSIWASLPGVSNGQYVDQYTDAMPVNPGETYDASVEASEHRGLSQCYIFFTDANGNWLSYQFLPGEGGVFGNANGDLSTDNLLGGFVTAPAGAVYARMVFRLVSNGQDSPYGFFAQPIFMPAAPGQTTPTPWSALSPSPTDMAWNSDGDSVSIDNFGSTFGYTSLLFGSTTYGNTIETAAGQTSALTLNDSNAPGQNIFIGGNGGNTIIAGSGDTWIQGGAGTDILIGGTGYDTIIAGSGHTTIYGGSGGGYYVAGSGSGTIFGGGGANTLVVGNAAGYMFAGGPGQTTFIVSQNNQWNWIDGGGGGGVAQNSTISFERWTYGVNVNLSNVGGVQGNSAAVALYGFGVMRVDNIIGSNYNDTLETGPSGGTLEGLGGADYLIGGGGITTASYQHSGSGVYVDLATDTGYGGDAQGDTFSNIQNLLGSSYDDELAGLSGSVLNGGPGDDTLDYSGGDNSYIGGGGFDTVDYAYAPSAVYVNLQSDYGAWAAAGDTYSGISEVIGSPYNDVIIGSSAGVTFNGGGGDDTFYGSGGDTYILDQGQGTESIYDTNSATNTLQVGPGITWDSIYFAAQGGSSGYLTVGLQGTGSAATVYDNFGAYPLNNNDILKTLDLDGASQLDISRIGYAPGVVNNALTGIDNQYNLLDAYGVGVPIYASGRAGVISSDGSVIVPGPGGHTIYASGAGDQFAMEYGDGQNVVVDAAQQNTIAFGSTVAASNVIYTVDAYGDLFIGLQSLSNPNLAANQVPDYIEFFEGGIETQNLNTGADTFPASYIVQAGGTTVNLSQLNIPWLVETTGGGGGYNLDPIVFDLNGDGLELSSVKASGIGTVNTNGLVTQLGWIGPDDGILVTDRGQNGAVNSTQDLSFVQDTPGANNDLQGLASWDTNGDGVLNASDTDWNQLEIWVDKNQDGVPEPGEVLTTAQAGITSISLKGQPSGVDPNYTTQSYLVATTTFTKSDGNTGAAYDVSLANDLVGATGPGDSASESWSDATPNATIGAVQASGSSLAVQSETLASSSLSALSSATLAFPSGLAPTAASVDGLSIDTSGAANVATPGAALWAGAPTAAAISSGWTLAAPTGPLSATALAGAALSGRGVAASAQRDLEPIVLDLSGAGLSLIDPTASSVSGNFGHTGTPETVGWVGGSNSVLAYAPGGAATIDPTSDLTFRNDLPGAETSIQGLKAFDTNADSVISAQDSSYANFYVWTDANGNGVADAGETQTLAQAGIASISLTPTSLDRDNGDFSTNQVIGQIQVTLADGTTRTGYDVGLGVEGAAAPSTNGTLSPPAPTAPSPPTVPAAALNDLASATTAGASTSSSPSAQTAASTPSPSPAVSMVVSQARSAEDGPEAPQGAAVAPAVNTDMANGWWNAAQSQTTSILNATTLAAFAAGSAPNTGQTAPSASSPDAATIQRQLLLAQSITAFQAGSTAGSPVWTREAFAAELSALTTPTAARPASQTSSLPIAA